MNWATMSGSHWVPAPSSMMASIHGSGQPHLLAQPNADPRDPLAVAPGVGVLGVDGGGQATDQAEQRFTEPFVDLALLAVTEQHPPGQEHHLQVRRSEQPPRMEAE